MWNTSFAPEPIYTDLLEQTVLEDRNQQMHTEEGYISPLFLHIELFSKICCTIIKKRDACVAQSVKHSTLDCSSGHDLRVVSSSGMLGSALSVEPAEDSLSPLLPPSTASACACPLFL